MATERPFDFELGSLRRGRDRTDVARAVNLQNRRALARKKTTTTVMENVQKLLIRYKEENNLNQGAMASVLGVVPKTIKDWIGPYKYHKTLPDLKWESLINICITLNHPLEDFLIGTKYEGKVPLTSQVKKKDPVFTHDQIPF